MNNIVKLIILSVFLSISHLAGSQKILEKYQPKKDDSLRIGIKRSDFLPYINKGYTLMPTENKKANGVLIFLEDSGFDLKNKSAKQIYKQAFKHGYAVLSVSTDIPFDFYFSKSSLRSTHQIIQQVFSEYSLPNKNIFFLGASMVGHRAMKYIEFTKKSNLEFQLDIKGIVICNFTMDWTRKWYQHKREIRIKKNDLWEATFINFMLETNLKGTPKDISENYHEFSTYSYFDQENRNIKYYKDLAIRTYVEPDIKYKYTRYLQTLYENNTTDMIGFMAELKLMGNMKTELVVIQPKNNSSTHKSTQATWDTIDKSDVMNWIVNQTKG